MTELVTELARGQPFISHHLRILREAGLVEGIRDGKRVCYRIAQRVKGALRGPPRSALDFGCCRISFPINRVSHTVKPLGTIAPKKEATWD